MTYTSHGAMTPADLEEYRRDTDTRRVCWKHDAALEIMRAAGIEPTTAFTRARDPWPSRCIACEKSISPSLSNVLKGHAGCRFCSAGTRRDPKRAVEELRSAGIEPSAPYPGPKGPWRGTCTTCGANVTPRLCSIRAGHRGCRVCAGKAPVDPELAVREMRRAGINPTAPFRRVLDPWPGVCLVCRSGVQPSLHSIRRGHGGCSRCAVSGFDFASPASVYLIVHDQLGAVKVGVTGVFARQDRIASFGRNGWRLVQQMNCRTGREAYEIEQEAHARLRLATGMHHYLAKADMGPLGGHEETFPLESVAPSEAWQLVQASHSELNQPEPDDDGCVHGRLLADDCDDCEQMELQS